MKSLKILVFSLVVLVLIPTIHTSAKTKMPETYMRCMEVVDLDYEKDLVTCVDAVGYEWQFYGCEDNAKGDLLCCLMGTCGTENITDDIILEITYSGYQMN